MSLPLFMTQKNKYWIGGFMYASCVMLYVLSNHFYLFEPQLLPFSRIDNLILFSPNTIWIYLSEYLFFFGIYFSVKNIKILNQYVYSYFGLYGISLIIFLLWPTTFPRDSFPLTMDIHPLTYFIFHSIRSSDTPACCCPSLHVSSVYLSAFIFFNECKTKLVFFLIWATAIAFSTLTTKQHYFLDVVFGFLMAILVYAFFYHYLTYSPRTLRGNP